MGMTATAIRFYTDSERIAYQKIDGMDEVLSAKPSDLEELSAKYPDAMFAIMIHEDMICRTTCQRLLCQNHSMYWYTNCAA